MYSCGGRQDSAHLDFRVLVAQLNPCDPGVDRRNKMRGRLPQWRDEAGNGGVIAAIVAAVMAALLFILHNAVHIAQVVR
jgi:hypothetical protein